MKGTGTLKLNLKYISFTIYNITVNTGVMLNRKGFKHIVGQFMRDITCM